MQKENILVQFSIFNAIEIQSLLLLKISCVDPIMFIKGISISTETLLKFGFLYSNDCIKLKETQNWIRRKNSALESLTTKGKTNK